METVVKLWLITQECYFHQQGIEKSSLEMINASVVMSTWGKVVQ
jgi:hypothetical protein